MKDQKKLVFALVVVVVIAVVGGLLLAGNSKSKNSSTTGSSATTAKSSTSASSESTNPISTTSVDIKDYMFSPMAIKVKVGDTVTWTNQDSVHHTVTADTASSDAPNGPLIGQGETYSFKFTKAGTYTFHCTPHPYMHGTVVVE